MGMGGNGLQLLCAHISGIADFQISRFVLDFPDFQVSRFILEIWKVSLKTSGNLEICESGNLEIWTSNLFIWKFGNLEICESGNLEIESALYVAVEVWISRFLIFYSSYSNFPGFQIPRFFKTNFPDFQKNLEICESRNRKPGNKVCLVS